MKSVLSLDDTQAGQRPLAEPVEAMTPETIFESQWATTLVYETLNQLKAEYAGAGKEYEFALLQDFLAGAKEAEGSYKELAARLHLSEAAVRQAAHRLRCRYRDLLRWQVAQTVLDRAEVDDELAHLRAVLSR